MLMSYILCNLRKSCRLTKCNPLTCKEALEDSVWQVTVSFQIGKTWKSVLQKHENEVVEQNNTTLEMMLESIGKILIGIRGTCEYV
jgi:hypothetical protein